MSLYETDHPRIVLLTSDEEEREKVRLALEGVGHLLAFNEEAAAVEAMEGEAVQLLIWGLPPDRLLSTDLLDRLRRERKLLDCVLLLDPEDARLAEPAMDRGVADAWLRPMWTAPLRHRVQALLGQRRLVREFRRLKDRLQTIEQSRVLAPFVDAEKVYPAVLSLLLRNGSRKRGFSFFVREEVPAGFDLVLQGFSDDAVDLLRRRLVQDKPLDLQDYRRVEVLDRGEIHSALRAAGVEVREILVVPIAGDETESGIACVLSDARLIAEHEVGQADLVADRGCEALRNVERYRHAREKAFVDDITEAYNARYLLSVLDREIRRADRYATGFSILFLDLDHFKRINDRYGHLVGSDVLNRASRLLLQCIRQVDTLARYGGDEFAILLCDARPAEARIVAERIRSTVANFGFEMRQGEPLALTFSIGIASFPEDGDSRDGLLDLADKAMYRAKSLGRNRVCAAAELAAAGPSED